MGTYKVKEFDLGEKLRLVPLTVFDLTGDTLQKSGNFARNINAKGGAVRAPLLLIRGTTPLQLREFFRSPM